MGSLDEDPVFELVETAPAPEPAPVEDDREAEERKSDENER